MEEAGDVQTAGSTVKGPVAAVQAAGFCQEGAEAAVEAAGRHRLPGKTVPEAPPNCGAWLA